MVRELAAAGQHASTMFTGHRFVRSARKVGVPGMIEDDVKDRRREERRIAVRTEPVSDPAIQRV